MKKTRFLTGSSSHKHQDSDTLFQGIWLQWGALTQAEKVVCLGIILIPIWWVIGWGMMLLFWVIGIVVYELWSYKSIRLSRPSLQVITIILFSLYRVVSIQINAPESTPRTLLDSFFNFGCAGLLLWYIQSHKIRVRLHVVAWAFSVAVCLMVVWWAFLHFVLSEPYYTPPRTLYAQLMDKGRFDASKLGSVGNFLSPYFPQDKGLGGLVRHSFFFPHPTVSSFVIGFGGLIFLDIKNRCLSRIFAGVCAFLILIAQTRNAWLSLAIVLVIRWIITNGKEKGIRFLLVLSAMIIFTTLSIPQVTNWITESYTTSVESTSNFRKESTEGRQKIYQRTWESFIEEPLWGHGVNGPSVVPGYEFAGLGSESFILGTLLYKSGLVGTGVFLAFYISLLVQLCKTRKDRPLCCFLMLLYFTLASSVTEFLGLELFLLLLCTILQKSHINQGKQSEFSIHKFPMS
ncbi:MAG: O-antigen ligase family protein [Gloeotrichia echinulata IR180]